MGKLEDQIHAIQRRRFLRCAGTALAGAAAGVPTLQAVAAECRLTEQEILGPMYNFGAPKARSGTRR